MDNILRVIKNFIPKKIFKAAQPVYHFLLSFLGALVYLFPSRHIKVIGVTGTKGKTTTIELINTILEEAGYKTALAGTLRIKIGDKSERNLYKMTMPGRFFTQKFLKKAVRADCNYAIIEITSEGVKQFRHKFLNLDGLVFTNISPEHIESHGSYEKYLEAKLKIAKALEKSNKKDKVIVVNSDDKEAVKFLSIKIPRKISYSLSCAKPFNLTKHSSRIMFEEENVSLKLPGEFNIYNALAAATFAKTQGVGIATIKKALEKFSGVRGRMERIEEGQDFTVVVDYAHTKDSLEKAYGAYPNTRKICVLGSTGGGRDKWKRKEMGSVADKYCEYIILTNEDPYDEDPHKIVEDVTQGIKNTEKKTIMDRREAIREALKQAHKDDIVFITGKGTDPYIMGQNGNKTPWDDATVTREELRKLLGNRTTK
jgi:UDP-N-acetylmuramoyl-L-alanyl-D-glutamate--2,6-diaminopimelate ligase